MSAAAPASSSRFAESSWALLLATIGSAVTAFVAASRVSGLAFGSAWLALWGSTALIAAPAAVALRVARPLSRLAWCVPLGLVIASGPLLVLARVLKSATHHRPLGGTTFAILATALILGAVALAARILIWSETGSMPRRRLPWLVTLVFGLAAAKLALGALAGPLRASALDALLALASAGAGALGPMPGRARSLALAGVPLAAAAVLLALTVGLASPDVRALLDAQAPVLLGLAGWLRGG